MHSPSAPKTSSDGDDAGQAALGIQHRQAAHAALAHDFDRLEQVLVFHAGGHAPAHHVGDRKRADVDALGYHRDDEVAVGQDADRHAFAVRLVDHNDRADVARTHGLGHFAQRGGGADVDDVAGTDVGNTHGNLAGDRTTCLRCALQVRRN